MQTRGVDKGYFTHSDDAYLGATAVACHDVLETVAGSEEVGTVDFINLYTLWDSEVFQIATFHIRIFVEVNLVENGMHIGRLCHASHEQQTGADEAKFDGDGEVEDNGEEESEQQYGDVALGIAQHGEE